jgi:hypothetical protein
MICLLLLPLFFYEINIIVVNIFYERVGQKEGLRGWIVWPISRGKIPKNEVISSSFVFT